MRFNFRLNAWVSVVALMSIGRWCLTNASTICELSINDERRPRTGPWWRRSGAARDECYWQRNCEIIKHSAIDATLVDNYMRYACTRSFKTQDQLMVSRTTYLRVTHEEHHLSFMYKSFHFLDTFATDQEHISHCQSSSMASVQKLQQSWKLMLVDK